MNNLQYLPYEVQEIIFDNLSVIDLINLRSVCINLRISIDSYRLKELISSKFKNGSNVKWYYLNRKVNKNNFIRIDLTNKKVYEQFKKIINLNMVKSIRLLKINYYPLSWNLDLLSDHIEKLNRLEHLEFTTYKRDDSILIQIKHSNIRILFIYSYCSRIIIECPNLEILYNNLKDQNLRTLNLNKIKHLDNIFTRNISIDNLLKFKNLEFIGFKNVNSLYDFNQLFKLNKLKTIDLSSLWRLDRILISRINNLILNKPISRQDLIIKFVDDLTDDELIKYNKKRKTNNYYYDDSNLF